MPVNINLAIIFRNNYGVKGSIMTVSGFKDYINYRFEQLDGSINLEHEKFEDAYFSVYGKNGIHLGMENFQMLKHKVNISGRMTNVS